MRETRFIAQNKDKWFEFEQVLDKKDKDPQKLSTLFVEVTDDLSHARTFYPNRSVRAYLNALAQKAFNRIYKSRRNKNIWGPNNQLYTFFSNTLPQIIFEQRQAFRLALVVFVLAIGIGVLSTHMNPEFPRIILGDSYVDMTLNNIANGNPMAVYGGDDSLEMSLRITFNNIQVAFLAFIAGLLFSSGTLIILLINGVMIGAFQYFFFQQGVYWDSILTIWLHGMLEISSIVIAGAAGIVLGQGFVFPGTYTRFQAFQYSARKGLQILLGTVPLFVLAGFIEGYLTRYTDVNFGTRLIFILSAFAFILVYFVILPWHKGSKTTLRHTHTFDTPNTSNITSIELYKIKSVPTLLSDTFIFYRQHIISFIKITAILALSYTFLAIFFQATLEIYRPSIDVFESIIQATYELLDLVLSTPLTSISGILIRIVISASIAAPLLYLHKFAHKKSTSNISQYVQYALFGISTGLLLPILWTSNLIMGILGFFTLALIGCALVGQSKSNLIRSFAQLPKLINTNGLTLLAAFLLMCVLCFALLFVLSAPLLWFYLSKIGAYLTVDPTLSAYIDQALISFSTVICISLLASLPFLVLGIGYFSTQEIAEATSLAKGVQKIGQKQKRYGIQTEDYDTPQTT